MIRDALILLTFVAAAFASIAPARANTAGEVVEVTGAWITLGDVADASGPLANVRVAPSPDIGQSLALDPQFVGAIARKNGVYFPSDVSGPIRISRIDPNAAKPVFNDAAPSENMHLVFTRDMQRDDIVTENDLAWRSDGDRNPYIGAPEMKSEVIGKTLRRSIRADRQFRVSDVELPAAVKKGEPVTLVYAKNGLKLTVDGKALEDAAIGASVRVLNNYSKRAVDAVVADIGVAHVHDR